MVLLDPKEGADAREKLLLVEGLLDEVVRPGIDRRDPVFALAGRDHDHGEEAGRWIVAQPPAHLVAAHAGHLNVEQDEVRRLLADALQRFGAG